MGNYVSSKCDLIIGKYSSLKAHFHKIIQKFEHIVYSGCISMSDEEVSLMINILKKSEHMMYKNLKISKSESISLHFPYISSKI